MDFLFEFLNIHINEKVIISHIAMALNGKT
jgi:hypothetical protein